MMRLLAYALSVLTVILAALVVPMPLVEFSPGGATSVPEELLEVEPTLDTTPINGDLSLLTVRLRQPSFAEVVRAAASPLRKLQTRQTVFPEGVEGEDYLELQRDEFRRTFELAVAVGLRAAGEDVAFSSAALVAQVVPGGPADGRLQAGDLVLAFEGEPVDTSAELVEAAGDLALGEAVTLQVERDGDEIDVEVVAGRIAEVDRPVLGISLLDVVDDVDLPDGIHMESTRIGGPSAGMMVALTTFDLFSDEDLAAGRHVAGTGTIDADGVVGPIGGVAEKVVAAAAAGADVMLVPAAQEEEAMSRARDGLRVIPVATLDEAIAALRAGG
ncbi:MAG: PDZ domain-containing protein [Actinobacteria bacterium]|nr:PDZ domain-containing protein [Actinomycetota bacterium]